MSIRNIGSPYGPSRTTPVAPTKGVQGPAAEPTSPATPAAPAGGATRSDSIEISDAGRAMAGTGSAGASSSLSAERVAELRKKVLEGAYNSVQVVDQVAKRILASGDL